MTTTHSEFKQSPLHQRHLAAGGRMIQFAGWQMPLQYRGIREEHLAVRQAVGIFDISHMGQLWVSGPQALEELNRLLTNRLTALSAGEGQYTFLLNERGGIIDDLIVYRTGTEEFLLVVNAARVTEDANWITARIGPGALVRNESDIFGGFAVQGPHAAAIFKSVLGSKPPARNRIVLLAQDGTEIFAAGTGYTGEEGFEVFFPTSIAEPLWDAFVAAGAEPCGLGARDTLRLEMCYPLNGADLSYDRTPWEAGLGFFVDIMKDDFVGKAALVAQKEAGLKSKLCALTVTDRSPPLRAHYSIFSDDTCIGETTSGALSPSLGYGIAMGYLPLEYSKPGTKLGVEVRQKIYPATVSPKPFYKKPE
ncbi:MAG: glycine cleavage system protein T [Verrucomicrobia bacterium]|nr:MAG: glycine cleavage system protein T [Verrucomicrobiota bacterium]